MFSKLLNPGKNTLRISCLGVTLAILAAGLWPFNFWAANEVEWLKTENGVHFYGQGIIFSEPLNSNSQRSLFPNGPFTIEIWLQPDTEPSSSLPHILSLYDGKKAEIFFLAQWKSALNLRMKVLQSNASWIYRDIGVAEALSKGRRRFITITANEKGTNIYLDGKLEEAHPYYPYIPKNATAAYQIILGNSPIGKHRWKGNIYGLALYNRSLTPDHVFRNFQNWTNKNLALLEEEKPMAFYPFTERHGTRIHDPLNHSTLFALSTIKVPQKSILVPPWKDFRFGLSLFKDIVYNILGFMPFGFIVSAYLFGKKIPSRRTLWVIVLLLGGLLSLVIEILQIYLPSRSSQFMDLFTNMSGTTLGLILYNYYYLKKRPFER